MILEILNELAATASTNAKLAILKKYKDNETLMNVFRLAYNKRIVYGIKKIPERQLYRGVIHFETALAELEGRFSTRQITGNAAIDRLQELMGSMHEDNAEVIRRVILRDLECGTGATLANKVWKDVVPSQPCMLATAQSDKALAKIKYPAVAQLKADGTRCMVVKQNGIVSAWSRNGKEFTGIKPILKAFEESDLDNFVLDGELVYKSDLGKKPVIESTTEPVRPCVCGDLSWMLGEQERTPELSKAKEFQEVEDRQTGNGIVSKAQKGTLTDEEAECIVLQAWDYIDVDAYNSGVYKVPYEGRMTCAKAAIEKINDIHIEWIETHIVYSLDEAKKLYQSYIDDGLEGIILKNLLGIWEDKRSANLVKFKEVIEFDAIVVGYYPHRKDPTKLGGLTIESKCGLIRCNVGSGFKDKTHEKAKGFGLSEIPMNLRHEYDRSRVLSEIDEWIDTVVQLECNGAIKRKNRKEGEAPYKLFLPTFQFRRHDKDKKDANTYEELFG